MLDTLWVSYSNSGDMTSNPVRCQVLWSSTQVSYPQNYSVLHNSRGFSLPGPTVGKFPYYLQQNTCRTQNAASLFATNPLLYEVWDLNTFFIYGKNKAVLDWHKRSFLGRRNFPWASSVPRRRKCEQALESGRIPRWQHRTFSATGHSCPCGGLGISHSSSLKSEVSLIQSMWGLYDLGNASLILAFTY